MSTSKLSQDRFQVVFPAKDSIFNPGIYNCRKNKSSAEHSIPIAHVGNLFHVHTCAEAEIKRHDRAENKWIIWHRRLGYMPFETIQQMIDTCQGLDDLQGISMPRNYVSANVRRGKATMMDQPKSKATRADRPLQVIHFDLFGPCIHPSFAGHKYCVVLVDDHSRYTWVYTVKNGFILSRTNPMYSRYSRSSMRTQQSFGASTLFVFFIATKQVKTFQLKC